jgi:hypothetical protein
VQESRLRVDIRHADQRDILQGALAGLQKNDDYRHIPRRVYERMPEAFQRIHTVTPHTPIERRGRRQRPMHAAITA